MVSPVDIRTDSPNTIRTEAMKMSIRFDRTGPSTGRISWNIPTPAAGCAADDQAYCGIIVTIDTVANNSTKIPTNGTVYASDPTVDDTLFVGDTINGSKVVGSFYRDRTTTFFDVTGLTEHGAYYVSGFPVDCENRYYREGIHAYSLNYSQDGTRPTSGTQVVILNPSKQPNGGIEPTDLTGLDPLETYTFNVRRGLVPKPNRPVGSQECIPTPHEYTIEITGNTATTYDDLLNQINIQLSQIDHPPVGSTSPNTGAYYYDSVTNILYQWNGSEHIEQQVITQATPPDNVVDGSYWLNTQTNRLYLYSVSYWVEVYVITLSYDPTQPICDQSTWFNGIVGYVWNGTSWIAETTYVDEIDPSKWQPAPCGSMWYDTANYELYKWDTTHNMWKPTYAIQHNIPPSQLIVGTHYTDNTLLEPSVVVVTSGTYWFDVKSNKLKHYGVEVDATDNNTVINNIPSWDVINNARIVETEPTVTSSPGTLWYQPSTMSLKQRNVANNGWTELSVIVFDIDPTDINQYLNWWNTVDDTISVWDAPNQTWNVVGVLYQQDDDPTRVPEITQGSLWYVSSTSSMYRWDNNCFKPIEYIYHPTDPRSTIPVGTTWHNTTNNIWYVKTVAGWNSIDITQSLTDPTLIPSGALWLDTSTNTLSVWNGVTWVSLLYSQQPLTPIKESMWFNTSINKLMIWKDGKWTYAVPKLKVDFNCNNNFIFTDTSTGSLSWVSIHNVTLFDSLTTGFVIDNPNPGTDGVSTEPLYQEIGIGTDGTNDERLQLMNEIRYSLGYPTVDVELTQEQLMMCIDNALQVLRQNSSLPYNRGFFFLQIQGETQKYLLTNKVQGMHKIVDILGIHRLTSAFLSSAHGAGVYGQIVMQHLYNMGTFDLLSYHLMTEYTKNLEILFAGRVTYTWNEQTRELHLHNRYPFSERMMLIDAAVERTEQHILSDRIARPWLRKWATAEAMMILANSRGKYSSLPGAGGGVNLNASDLRMQATADKEQCMQEIFDYVADTPEEYGVQGTITYG